jgi:hypothetical protein
VSQMRQAVVVAANVHCAVAGETKHNRGDGKQRAENETRQKDGFHGTQLDVGVLLVITRVNRRYVPF